MISRRTLLAAAPLSLLAGTGKAGELTASTPRPIKLTIFDRDDRSRDLADIVGRITLLHFWASWCGPCRTEFPALDALQRELADQGVKVAAISLDRMGWPVINAMVEKLGIRDVAVFHDRNRAVAHDLGVVGIPTTIVVDSSGHEVARLVGVGDWASPDLRRRILAV